MGLLRLIQERERSSKKSSIIVQIWGQKSVAYSTCFAVSAQGDHALVNRLCRLKSRSNFISPLDRLQSCPTPAKLLIAQEFVAPDFAAPSFAEYGHEGLPVTG